MISKGKVHGGKRQGAGRPTGTGKFGEKTVPVRVPASLLSDVRTFVESGGYSVPFFTSKVAAGMPTFADDHVNRISLASHFVKHPGDTFCVQVQGESMINAGIEPDDILVVDRKLEARDGKIIIAAVNGELTVKRLKRQSGKVFLMPENENYNPIEIAENEALHIWGVVTNVVKEAK